MDSEHLKKKWYLVYRKLPATSTLLLKKAELTLEPIDLYKRLDDDLDVLPPKLTMNCF